MNTFCIDLIYGHRKKAKELRLAILQKEVLKKTHGSMFDTLHDT